MKTLYGYLILLISFSGLIYLKQSASNKASVSQRYFNSNTNIDSKIRKRIAKLEEVVVLDGVEKLNHKKFISLVTVFSISLQTI